MIKDWESEPNDSIVCYCQKITKGEIVEVIELGCDTLELIRDKTKACTMGNCKILNPSGKCCSSDIAQIIELYK